MNTYKLNPLADETYYFIGGYILSIKENQPKHYFNFYMKSDDEGVLSIRCFSNSPYAEIVKDAFEKKVQLSCIYSKNDKYNGYLIVKPFAFFNTNPNGGNTNENVQSENELQDELEPQENEYEQLTLFSEIGSNGLPF